MSDQAIEASTHWLDHPEMPDAFDIADRGRYSRRASKFLGGWRMFCYAEKVNPAKVELAGSKKRDPNYWIARGWLAAKACADAGTKPRP